eukprot:3173924-Rhodomonas_salina.1
MQRVCIGQLTCGRPLRTRPTCSQVRTSLRTSLRACYAMSGIELRQQGPGGTSNVQACRRCPLAGARVWPTTRRVLATPPAPTARPVL